MDLVHKIENHIREFLAEFLQFYSIGQQMVATGISDTEVVCPACSGLRVLPTLIVPLPASERQSGVVIRRVQSENLDWKLYRKRHQLSGGRLRTSYAFIRFTTAPL